MLPNSCFRSLLISLNVGLILILCSCISGRDYYVKPSSESECPSSSQSDPCKTLDEYAKSAEDLNGEVSMLFLGGTHNLTMHLNLSNLDTLQMKPADTAHEMVIIQLLCCNVTFQSVSNLTAKNLTIQSATVDSPQVVAHNVWLTFQQVHVIGVCLRVTADGNVMDVMNITIQDSLLERSNGTGLLVIASRSQGQRLNLEVLQSSVSHHQQGGIIVESTSTLNINIRDSFIGHNKITSTITNSTVSAAGFSVHSTNAQVHIGSSHFVSNKDLRGHPVTVFVSRAESVEISNCEFRDNRGTAIRAANIPNAIRLSETVIFLRNTAMQGGALTLVSSQVYFRQFSHILFMENSADDVGGAIFVESTSIMYEENDPNTLVKCFYRLPDWSSSNPNEYNVTFNNNSAKNGGQHIYGASLLSYCVVYDWYRTGEGSVPSNNPDVQKIFHIDDKRISSISSNPSRVCVLDHTTSNQSYYSVEEYCTNKSQIFKNLSSIPGEEFLVEAVLVGAEFGTGTGAVYAQFLIHNGTKANLYPSYQYSQKINQINTTQTLNYSIFSNNSYEILVLTATDGTVLVNGDEDQIDEAIKIYEDSGIIPSLLLTTPVYINVSLSQCPSGFYHDPISMGCECNPKLCDAQVKGKLSDGEGLIYLEENVWVNAYNKGNVSGIMIHHNCPFDYCSIEKSRAINLDDPDTQCAMDRSGVLCGKCKSGFSLAIGSDKCLPCRNNDGLLLLLFFAAAGPLLVFFIKLLNLTVSQGTINGLIFYANIIWAYQNVFFQEALVAKFPFFYVFIAWINLDFGIETCFFKDLTAFWKTWLQFVFPLYIWSIAGGMILLARYSNRMTKLFGNNSVHVLATLFLLSYTKLLRIMIAVLVPANLYVYTDDGKPVPSQTRLVWALDGSLLYGRVPHIFLMLMILLVVIPFLWLPYTFSLLFIQPLRKFSNLKCLRWVNRLKPLFDAYVGPLNPPNHHWVGLLLLARFILLLTFTLTYPDNPSTSLLALVIVAVFLLVVLSYTGRLYDHPTRFQSRFLPQGMSFRSILEVSFLFNLIAVGVSILYLQEDTDTKEIITNTSIGITFVQCMGIILHHILYILKNLICKSASVDTVNSSSEEYQNLDEEHETVTAPTTTSINMGTKPSSETYASNEYRELLLTESTP